MNNKMNCKIPDPRGNFRKVVIPAVMGDDSGEFAPQNGAYHDALVKYEANGAIYIYSSDGIPTKISNSIDGLKALAFKDKADYDEDIINKPEIPTKTSDLLNDSGFITSEYHDISKQDALTAGDNITIENNVISATGGGQKDYISLERNSDYLYTVTFDSIPEEDEAIFSIPGACTSFVRGGKLHRNLDWKYDDTASFRIITRTFEGMGYINGLNAGSLDDAKIGQLPYHIADGVNKNGIMVSTHVLYNDWEWDGSGNINLTRLPYEILTRVRSMETIAEDLAPVLSDLKLPQAMAAVEYLVQFVVTDGETTYAILPPTSSIGGYVLQDISSRPKLTNFRWVSDNVVVRTNLQDRPTGVERWNSMQYLEEAQLEDLRFTKAYEAPNRLSEFIGIDGTDKDSTDAELTAIYNEAHAAYENRTRNGETWQTVYSVIYSSNGIEHLYTQENWNKDYIAKDAPYQLVNEIIEGDNAGLILGDLDLTTYDGGGLMFLKNAGEEETSRSLGALGIDDIEIEVPNLVFEGTDDARFGGNNGWIIFDDSEVRIGSEGRDIILQPEGNTGKKVYYRDDNVTTYTADDEVATVGYVNEHAGGGTPVEAGKGIEVEEYAPLSITMEVTGELPPDFEDILPVSISLTNVKPGTTMYDLYLEGRLTYEQMFYWDTVYTMTTSGIDEDVISIAETYNELYVIQFNGAGTTAGTITATRGTESYTANVTATITAGDNASYVSKGRYQFPVGALMAFIEMSFGDEIEDPEELLEIFQGQDNVDALINAIKKGYEFYGSADGISIEFQTLMYDEYGIVLLMQSGGDFDSAILSIRIEDGEASSLSKIAVIGTFNEDSDGLVPKPGYSQTGSKFLRDDGTWAEAGGGVSTVPIPIELAQAFEGMDYGDEMSAADVISALGGASAAATFFQAIRNGATPKCDISIDEDYRVVINTMVSTMTPDSIKIFVPEYSALMAFNMAGDTTTEGMVKISIIPD